MQKATEADADYNKGLVSLCIVYISTTSLIQPQALKAAHKNAKAVEKMATGQSKRSRDDVEAVLVDTEHVEGMGGDRFLQVSCCESSESG